MGRKKLSVEAKTENKALTAKIADLDIESRFSDEKERKIAKDIVTRYLSEFSIETISDKHTLAELIYYEVLQVRLRSRLNEFSEASKAIPTQFIDTMRDNSDTILKLKTSLGLHTDKDVKKGYDVIADIMRRGKLWLQQNQASRHRRCPHCSKMLLLKIDPTKWELQKHPFFHDNFIYNEHLMSLYKLGKITKLDVARVYETSEEYIDWVLDKVEGKKATDIQPSMQEVKSTLNKEDLDISVVPQPTSTVSGDSATTV